MATKKIIEDAPLDDAVADDDYEGIDAEAADDGTYTVDDTPPTDYDADAPLVDDGYIDGVPPPITPVTPLLPAQERVLWENEVNDAARAFGRRAELAYIDARVAGNDIELTVIEADDAEVVYEPKE